MEPPILNSRERALNAIHLREPDKVPVFELGIAPKVSSKILGRTPLYSNEPQILKMLSDGVHRENIESIIVNDVVDLFHKKLKHDVIGVGMSESSMGAGLPSFFKGYGTLFALNASTVRSTGDNRWNIDGHNFRYIPETNYLLSDPPITSTPEEVESYVKEHWNVLGEISQADLYQEKELIRVLHDKVLTLAAIGDLGTFHTWEIDHILHWVYSHPATVERFVQHDARLCTEVAKIKMDMGIDVCLVDCDWGSTHGPFMSPTHFRQIWYPALKSVVDAVHRKGGFILAHADGNVDPILEDMVKAGLDGIHSVQPSAGMDIGLVKKRFGDKISLWGNIDIPYPLTFGTVEDTIEATRDCIQKAAPGGGHILCSTNSIGTNVRFENYMAMIDAANKFGGYPISAT